MWEDKKKEVAVKAKGVEIDLDNLEDDDIVSMTSNEVEEAIIQILQTTDKEIQRDLSWP